MNRAQALITLAIVAICAVSTYIVPAYAHGISTCITSAGGCALAKDNEQYSSSYSNGTVNMNDRTSGVLTITGTLKNKYYNTTITVVPYLSIGGPESNPFGFSELNRLLRLFYPLYNDPVSWYFKVDSNLTNPVVVKPRQEINYEIKVYPLKAGNYHVHSTFVYDLLNDGRYRFYQSTGRGEGLTVIGATTPTTGEVTQLIFPFVIGGTMIPILVLRAKSIAGMQSVSSAGTNHSKLRLGIRLYFALKSSLETVWLAGLLFWFIFVAYPSFHSFESRILSMIGMIAIVAAITVGGYIAALAKSNQIHVVFAIGTAVASVLVYFLLSLISYYLFIADDGRGIPFYYNLLPTSGIGYYDNQFEFYGPLPLTALIVNSAVAILSAYTIRRERRNVSKVLMVGIGILTFFAIWFWR